MQTIYKQYNGYNNTPFLLANFYSYRPPLCERGLYLFDVTATYLCTRTCHHCVKEVCIYLMLQPLTFVLIHATTVGKRFVFI